MLYLVYRNDGNRLVSREVVRLVTPGTLLEPLNNETNNYLMAIATGPGESLGLAWIDISTACFEVILIILCIVMILCIINRCYLLLILMNISIEFLLQK